MSYTQTTTLVRSVAAWLKADRERRATEADSALCRPLDNKLVLWSLLGLLFLINLIETTVETLWESSAWGEIAVRWGTYLSQASLEFEPGLSFANHQAAGWTAVYGYSISYFFVFPALCVLVAIALSRRETASPFRVFTLSLGAAYALSLPFFLLFPVIERWAFPGSEAILLSDLWSSSLIDSVRSISGLDNCFPSTHTSFTVIAILLSFQYRVRLRWAVLGLGLTVIISTFVLGIHWVPDIFAGVMVAGLSVTGAHLAEARIRRGDGVAEERPLQAVAFAKPEHEISEQPAPDGPGLPVDEKTRIFLSYRREDAAFAAEAVYKGLAERFGREAVFKDVDNIPAGVDFRDHITSAVRNCGVFVAVIGREWHGPLGNGVSRIQDEQDFVRIEVEEALQREIPLIPVLVDGASMPGKEEALPDSIEALKFKNALEVRTPPDLSGDVERLCGAVDQHLSAAASSMRAPRFAAM